MDSLDKYLAVVARTNTSLMSPVAWANEMGHESLSAATLRAHGVTKSTPVDYYLYATMRGTPL